MPAVFVHGVADTYRLWDGLREHLSRTDVVALSLPGFGSSLPAGFNASKEDYVSWIIGQLDRIGEPVDLVGHDWGCLFAMRVLTLRSELIRSWAVGSGPVNARYEWHPMAKIWQTPVEGERFMETLDKSTLTNFMHQTGVPKAMAAETTGRIDKTMKDAILKLYRSAIQVGAEWQPALTTIEKPGVVFWGQRDVDCPPEYADRLGSDAHARQVVKLDAGHWVPLERPRELAKLLEAHWNSL